MSGTVSLFGPGETLFFRPTRMLGVIIPDCAVEERHSDRVQVTQQPVEYGAMISDHAILLPFELSVRYGWWDGAFPFDFGHAQQVYEQLQSLQAAREPFDVLTGKRQYQNMVLTDMEVTTDQHTENVLMVELHLQQVIIVTTSTTSAASQSTQALPAQTAGQVSQGQQQLSGPSTPSITGLTSGPLVPNV
jgi:hypothetical protein